MFYEIFPSFLEQFQMFIWLKKWIWNTVKKNFEGKTKMNKGMAHKMFTDPVYRDFTSMKGSNLKTFILSTIEQNYFYL